MTLKDLYLESPTKRTGFIIKVLGSTVLPNLNVATQVKKYRFDCPFTYTIYTELQICINMGAFPSVGLKER